MVLNKALLLLIFSIVLLSDSYSQQLPITNIYCAHIANSAASEWKVNKLELLNSFNTNQYNNQPFFINDKNLLCTIKKENSTSTDIYLLNLKDKSYKNLIDNIGNDYSARVNPEYSEDITCVHVDPLDTIQKLVSFSSNDGSYQNTILDKVGQIGYYRYHKDNDWICFLVDSPYNLLSICNSSTKERKIFASSIGRTFESDHKNLVYFVHKILEDQWILKTYNVSTQTLLTIAKMPVHAEDFIIDSKGRMICSSDSKIMLLNPKTQQWETLIDFIDLGIKNIGRLTLRNELLVFVNEVK